MSTKRWPNPKGRRNLYICECDACGMSYGLSVHYLSFSREDHHICPDCLEEHWSDLQGVNIDSMKIPCVEYPYTSSPA